MLNFAKFLESFEYEYTITFIDRNCVMRTNITFFSNPILIANSSIREGFKEILKKVIYITLGSDPPPLESDGNIFHFFEHFLKKNAFMPPLRKIFKICYE